MYAIKQATICISARVLIMHCRGFIAVYRINELSPLSRTKAQSTNCSFLNVALCLKCIHSDQSQITLLSDDNVC